MNSTAQPQLIALSEGANIPLDKPIVLIGRHQECDIQIPSRKISRRHCCVAQVADHLVIRDLGSTNGIRINGTRVMEGSLKPNDEVTIGNMTYQVKWTDESIETVRATEKNAVKAGNPPLAQNRLQDESLDEPLPIPDISNQYPVLPAMPAKVVPHPAKAHSLEIPDDLPLAPLDPPVR